MQRALNRCHGLRINLPELITSNGISLPVPGHAAAAQGSTSLAMPPSNFFFSSLY